MINLILFGTFFIFLLLNTPIAVSLGMSSILAMIYAGDKMSVIPTNLFSGMAKFLLLAIPFFVLSGNVMAESGISKRLVHFIDNCTWSPCSSARFRVPAPRPWRRWASS